MLPEFLIGVDIGGTTTRVAIGGEDSGLIQVERFPTQRDSEPEALVRECEKVAIKLLRAAGSTLSNVAGIGVVVPGSLDLKKGVVRVASNLRWEHVPLGSLFEGAFGCATGVENDANAAALGEWHVMEGREDGLFIYLSIGTGVGAGLIYNGHIWHGHDGLAGEIGHTTIERGGPACNCGSRGCLEVVASGLALERLTREAVVMGAIPKSVKTASDLATAAASGNESAQEILDDVSDAIATAVKNLIHLLNPVAICLGGGVIQGTGMFESVRSQVSADPLLGLRTPHLLKSTLGDDAGLVGALQVATN